jgi:membrane protease YdiL (CAAX protease family)
MGLISSFLSLLLAAYTVLIEPIIRTNFYRNIKKQLKIDAKARLLFYRTNVLWEWSWVIVLAVILIPQPSPLIYIGLTMPSLMGWIILAALVIGIGLSIYLLRRNPRSLEAMQHSLESSSVILPGTPGERTWYAAMAITAGICEELLYRGFLLRFLAIYFFSLGWLFSAIISGVIYGLGHAYLGRKNMLQTMLNGFSFAILYFLSGNLLSAIGSSQPVTLVGSVIPAMVFHALAELRPLFLWQTVGKKKNTRP